MDNGYPPSSAPRSDPPGGQATRQAVARVNRRSPENFSHLERMVGRWECRTSDIRVKAGVVGEGAGHVQPTDSPGSERMACREGTDSESTEPTRRSPRPAGTAKAQRITSHAGKSLRASEWGGWGQVSVDGPGHYNPDRSEGPWGRATVVARMVVHHRAGVLDTGRGRHAATGGTHGGCKRGDVAYGRRLGRHRLTGQP